MSSIDSLSGKFSTARLPEIYVSRQDLLNTFYRKAEKSVIFVSAPAGYGKTVSTLLWLSHSGREPIWIGLDGYDNTPAIFYKLFCTAITSIQPNNTAMADILRDPTFAASPVEHTIALLSEFIPDDKQYALVLDDMHLVTNEVIRKSGLLVQKRLPSSFVTLILSRNEIAGEYIDVLGSENYSIIDGQDLAFSVEEIQKYFNAYGRFITQEEAQAIHDITGGWAISINALSMSGQINVGQNSSQILGDYLKTQIWDKWDESLRNFMLQTSLVDVMTTELAYKLTERKDSAQILEQLCAKNSFVSHVGNDVYQYHPLFLEFLRNMQMQDQEKSINTLYKKAADYYLENGDFFAARRYAIKSGDAASMVNSTYALLNTGKSASLDEYVNFYLNFLKEPIPEHVCSKNPYIYSIYVWYYFLVGNAQKMEYYMDMLYQHLPLIVQKYPQLAESCILIIATDHRVSLTQQIERFKLFPISPETNGQLKVTSLTMQMPYTHRTLRDYCELAEEEALEQLFHYCGVLLKTQRQVAQLELRSGFLYEQNRLKEALNIALQTQTTIDEDTMDELVFCSFFHLASIYFALGKEHLFADVIRQAEQYIEKGGYYHLRPNIAAFKTKMLLMDGDKTAARTWLDNYFVTEPEQLELYKIFQHFTTARAYLTLSQTDRAMRYILKLKKLATDFVRPLDIAEANILHSILSWALGDKKVAVSIAEAALTSMQNYGFIRVFADEGAAILPILKRLAVTIKKDTYQGTLNSKFLHEVTIAAYEQAKRHSGLVTNIMDAKPTRLSKQQKNVLTMLSKGYKNADIATLTGLSIHTVKSHCAAAYTKLEVNNAMDAVLKAKELGLI